MSKMISVKLWTSSHGLARRHLPQYITEAFEKQNKFSTPEIDARSGRQLNLSVIRTILKNVRTDHPAHQVHILALGKLKLL